MAVDPQLLEILACPDTHHAALEYDPTAQTLTCVECGRIFEVRDDVPVLLLDEARPPVSGGPNPAGGSPPGAGDQPAAAGGRPAPSATAEPGQADR